MLTYRRPDCQIIYESKELCVCAIHMFIIPNIVVQYEQVTSAQKYNVHQTSKFNQIILTYEQCQLSGHWSTAYRHRRQSPMREDSLAINLSIAPFKTAKHNVHSVRMFVTGSNRCAFSSSPNRHCTACVDPLHSITIQQLIVFMPMYCLSPTFDVTTIRSIGHVFSPFCPNMQIIGLMGS